MKLIRSRWPARAVAICICGMAMALPSARAANIVYGENPGAVDFTDGANWVGGVPPGTEDLPFINSGDGVNDYPYVQTSVGVLRFLIAEQPDDTGGLEIRSGGTVTTSLTGASYVGARGEGHLRIQDGGTLNINGSLQVGWSDSSGRGVGTVTQTGGTYNGTSTSTSITLGAGGANDTFPQPSMGTYNLTGGSMSLGSALVVGNAGIGQFNMDGGSVIINTYLQIGRTGTGSFVQSAGPLEVYQAGTGYGMVIAPFAGANGLYEISGGSLFVGDGSLGVANGVVADTGDSAGTFRVIGNDPTITIGSGYRQFAGSTLDMHIGAGISPLNVGMDLTLDGELSVLFTETPTLGQQFTLATYGGALTGAFSAFDNLVDSPLGADTIELSIDYGAGFGSAVVVTVDNIGSPMVAGDFNGDGGVDGADFVIWQTNFPNNSGVATLNMGDANGDGNVDGADFVVWQTNFPTAPSSMAPVPEPASGILVLIAACGALAVRRRAAQRQK